VSPDATEAEIRAAHRKLSQRVHPDAGGTDALFRRVQVAYETLSDPERRAEYDRMRSRPGRDGGGDPSDGGWTAGDDGSGGGGGGDFGGGAWSAGDNEWGEPGGAAGGFGPGGRSGPGWDEPVASAPSRAGSRTAPSWIARHPALGALLAANRRSLGLELVVAGGGQPGVRPGNARLRGGARCCARTPPAPASPGAVPARRGLLGRPAGLDGGVARATRTGAPGATDGRGARRAGLPARAAAGGWARPVRRGGGGRAEADRRGRGARARLPDAGAGAGRSFGWEDARAARARGCCRAMLAFAREDGDGSLPRALGPETPGPRGRPGWARWAGSRRARAGWHCGGASGGGGCRLGGTRAGRGLPERLGGRDSRRSNGWETRCFRAPAVGVRPLS